MTKSKGYDIIMAKKQWDSSKHPREPAGCTEGGQFTEKDKAVSSDTKIKKAKITRQLHEHKKAEALYGSNSSPQSDEEIERLKRIAAVTNLEWFVFYEEIANMKIYYGDDFFSPTDIFRIKIDDKVFIASGGFEKTYVLDVIDIHDYKNSIFEEEFENGK